MQTFIIIGIGFLIYILYQKKLFGSSIITNNQTDPKNITYNLTQEEMTLASVVKDKFYIELLEPIKGLEISLSSALAVMTMESGSFIKRNIPNSQVIGDNGTAFGYFQVRKPALIDANRFLGTNYNTNDLKNVNVNLKIGSTYLALCQQSALRQGSTNPVKLAFKKYNGGIDETDTSINFKATNYSDKAYNYYLYFEATLGVN